MKSGYHKNYPDNVQNSIHVVISSQKDNRYKYSGKEFAKNANCSGLLYIHLSIQALHYL